MSDNTISILELPDGNQLSIKRGLTDSQINQLIKYSKSDESLKKYTSDPQRFASREGFDEFSTHIMEYYALVDLEDNLMGVIWFDDFPFPSSGVTSLQDHEMTKQSSSNQIATLDARDDSNYGISFAIRLYGSARGQGLAIPFTQKSLEDFKQSMNYQQKTNNQIWLAVSPDNIPGIATYKKVGFKQVGKWKEKNKLLMILK